MTIAARNGTGEASLFQMTYPDIDRRGNVFNMINAAIGAIRE